MSSAIALIPFDEIVPGATVRVTTIDGVQYLSIRDIIMCVCSKDANQAGAVWRNMGSRNKEELWEHVTEFQFHGPGQSEQPVITLEGALILLVFLPGKKALLYKRKFADIIIRYLDGDISLISEIHANKALGKDRSYLKFARQTKQSIDTECLDHDNMPSIAYIYATKSQAFPDLIKIGRSGDVQARLMQLNTGCAPLPHAVVAVAPTLDMHRDEKLAHQHFAYARCKGEFFAVTENEVSDYFINHIMARHQKDLLRHMSSA